MDYNFRYNTNPYKDRTTHIPYTHYESVAIGDNKIAFIFNSIVKKLELFNESLSVFDTGSFPGQFISVNINDDPKYKKLGSLLSATDAQALILLNKIMFPLIGSASYFRDQINDSSDSEFDAELVKDYLISSGSNEHYISNTINNPSGQVYPYSLNIVDTSTPMNLFYEIKSISETLTVVIVFESFLSSLQIEDSESKPTNKISETMSALAKSLMINQLQYVPYNDIYKSGLSNLFSFYLKSL